MRIKRLGSLLAVASGMLVAMIVPTTAAAGGPSGVPIPSGNLDGWKQIFSEDFDRDARLGSFPGSAYGSRWDVYSGRDTTGKAEYNAAKVLSVHDGVLDWFLHTENGVHYTATTLPKLDGYDAYKGIKYGRFTTRFSVTQSAPLYSQVFLLWPDSESWPADGEFDFPAGDLGGTIGATAIHANPNNIREQFESTYHFTTWHTATLEWSPGLARFYVDGDMIGSTTKDVASNPMHYVLQVESTETAASAPSDSTSTHLQLDWFTVYAYSPGTPASPPGGGAGGGGGGKTAVTARIAIQPGRCTRAKQRKVSGAIALRFPAKAHRRAARLAGKSFRQFSNIDTTSLPNGAHRISVGYNKPGHRRMHGCAWVKVAN